MAGRDGLCTRLAGHVLRAHNMDMFRGKSASANCEVLNWADEVVPLAISSYRINAEIVGGPRLEMVDANPEEGRCVVGVQPDRRCCSLSEAIRPRTVMHEAVMNRRAAGSVGAPADDRQILCRQLNLRP